MLKSACQTIVMEDPIKNCTRDVSQGMLYGLVNDFRELEHSDLSILIVNQISEDK